MSTDFDIASVKITHYFDSFEVMLGGIGLDRIKTDFDHSLEGIPHRTRHEKENVVIHTDGFHCNLIFQTSDFESVKAFFEPYMTEKTRPMFATFKTREIKHRSSQEGPFELTFNLFSMAILFQTSKIDAQSFIANLKQFEALTPISLHAWNLARCLTAVEANDVSVDLGMQFLKGRREYFVEDIPDIELVPSSSKRISAQITTTSTAPVEYINRGSSTYNRKPYSVFEIASIPTVEEILNTDLTPPVCPRSFVYPEPRSPINPNAMAAMTKQARTLCFAWAIQTNFNVYSDDLLYPLLEQCVFLGRTLFGMPAVITNPQIIDKLIHRWRANYSLSIRGDFQQFEPKLLR